MGVVRWSVARRARDDAIVGENQQRGRSRPSRASAVSSSRGDDASARRVAVPRARAGVARRGEERCARDSARESSSREVSDRSPGRALGRSGKAEARTYQRHHRGMLRPRGRGWLVHSHRDGLVPHVRAFAITRASAARVPDSSAPRPTRTSRPVRSISRFPRSPPRTRNYSRTTAPPPTRSLNAPPKGGVRRGGGSLPNATRDECVASRV